MKLIKSPENLVQSARAHELESERLRFARKLMISEVLRLLTLSWANSVSLLVKEKGNAEENWVLVHGRPLAGVGAMFQEAEDLLLQSKLKLDCRLDPNNLRRSLPHILCELITQRLPVYLTDDLLVYPATYEYLVVDGPDPRFGLFEFSYRPSLRLDLLENQVTCMREALAKLEHRTDS